MATAATLLLESNGKRASESNALSEQPIGNNRATNSSAARLTPPPPQQTCDHLLQVGTRTIDNDFLIKCPRPDGEQLRLNVYGPEEIRCSAVHTLERDMPHFDYSHLVRQLRQLILDDQVKNPGIYSQRDIERLQHDDWFVARYLLRQKLDTELAFQMMRKAMRFRHESLCTCIRPEDFPAEFYLLGGLFSYEPDRKGNKMLYLRVRVHRKVPEITSVLQAFIFYQLQRLDEEADGKGEY